MKTDIKGGNHPSKLLSCGPSLPQCENEHQNNKDKRGASPTQGSKREKAPGKAAEDRSGESSAGRGGGQMQL